MKIVIADSYGSSYYRPFANFAPRAPIDLLFENPKKVLCCVFTGGEDVDPSLYCEEANHKTYSNPRRDQDEERIFNQAAKAGVPMAGICRGAQFLCVMNGGKLVQHVNGHSGLHPVRTTLLDYTVEVTSTHHQMALPPDNAIVIAWAEPRLSNVYEGAPNQYLEPPYEYEGVYYPETRSLGMQWHPEFMSKNTAGWQFTQELIAKFLDDAL